MKYWLFCAIMDSCCFVDVGVDAFRGVELASLVF